MMDQIFKEVELKDDLRDKLEFLGYKIKRNSKQTQEKYENQEDFIKNITDSDLQTIVNLYNQIRMVFKQVA